MVAKLFPHDHPLPPLLHSPHARQSPPMARCRGYPRRGTNPRLRPLSPARRRRGRQRRERPLHTPVPADTVPGARRICRALGHGRGLALAPTVAGHERGPHLARGRPRVPRSVAAGRFWRRAPRARPRQAVVQPQRLARPQYRKLQGLVRRRGPRRAGGTARRPADQPPRVVLWRGGTEPRKTGRLFGAPRAPAGYPKSNAQGKRHGGFQHDVLGGLEPPQRHRAGARREPRFWRDQQGVATQINALLLSARFVGQQSESSLTSRKVDQNGRFGWKRGMFVVPLFYSCLY